MVKISKEKVLSCEFNYRKKEKKLECSKVLKKDNFKKEFIADVDGLWMNENLDHVIMYTKYFTKNRSVGIEIKFSEEVDCNPWKQDELIFLSCLPKK